MKFIFVTSLIISTIFIFSGAYFAEELYANPNTAIAGANKKEYKSNSIPEYIDDIQVPGEVINYIHTTYQGYAITQIVKTTRNGEEIYKLKVSSDSYSSYENSTFLLYNNLWKLIGDELVQPPPARTAPVPEIVAPTTENEVPANVEPEISPEINTDVSSVDTTTDNTDEIINEEVNEEVNPVEQLP